MQSVHRWSDNPVRTLSENRSWEALPTASEKGMKTCASYEMPMQVDAASVLVHVISVVESGELWDNKLHTSAKKGSDLSGPPGLCP